MLFSYGISSGQVQEPGTSELCKGVVPQVPPPSSSCSENDFYSCYCGEKLLKYEEFHRRLEGTRFQGKLKFSNMSSSVGNFQVKEEMNSRLPVNYFMSMFYVEI